MFLYFKKTILNHTVRALLGMCCAIVLTACQIELNTNLEEQEANEMLARLLANGIVASKKMQKDTAILMVDRDQFGEAVDLLKTYGLPRKKFASTEDFFNNSGLVASPMQEWARFTYAKSQELSQTLSSIPGVMKASVHIADQRKENPFDEEKPPSASVLIQINQDMLTDDLIPQIKQLVSFSLPDISYDKVGVVISKTQVQSRPQPMVSIGGMIVHQDSAQLIYILLIISAITSVTSIGLGIVFLINFLKARKSKQLSQSAKAVAS